MYKATILVVDDSSDYRELVCLILQKSGYRTLSAENGLAGLNVLASGVPIDVIVSDVHMPVADGLWLLEQAQQSGCRAGFILMSGDWEPTSLAPICATLIRKPLASDTILHAVSTCLIARSSQPQPQNFGLNQP